jgi:predicted NUDIX family NTP pyrophosphohydrolase
MPRKSAGILLYRKKNEVLEVFLVHPGGPFWANKDAGAWSIPKGEFTEEEDPLDAAQREFLEETGSVAAGTFTELAPVTQKGGKIVFAFAIEGDIDAETIHSNTYAVEWPPYSGKWPGRGGLQWARRS